jgi:hypothetical protein
VALSLDLETDPLAPGGSARASAPSDNRLAAPRPKKRARSQIVTRKEPSQIGAFLFKSLLLIALVAGAGGAYRYHKYGYVLPQQAPPAVVLIVDADPQDANFYVNDALTPERSLELKGGKSYVLRLSAAHRLEMLGEVQTHAGDKIRVSQVLWHEVLPIDAEVVSEVVADESEQESEALSSEAMMAARAKMDAYGDCASRVAKALAEDSADKGLEPLPRKLSDECLATFDLAIGLEPGLDDLDKVSASFRDALANFGQAMEEQKRSKGGAGRIQRQRMEEARAAARSMNKSAELWTRTMSAVQARWHLSELVRAKQSGEDPLHADVRGLAVASDAWMRTHLAGKAAKTQRSLMTERFAMLSKLAGQRSDELKERGVTGYLNALRPLIENEPGEDALFWHNQSVEMFNKIRLPLLIAVDSADQ